MTEDKDNTYRMTGDEKTIRRAPDKIGNVNKSIPPVMKRAQRNNETPRRKKRPLLPSSYSFIVPVRICLGLFSFLRSLPGI